MTLFLIAFYAVANRFCGGGFEKPQGPLPDLPGRAVWYVALITLVCGWIAFGWAGVVAALAFITYREPAWSAVFGAWKDFSRVDRPRLRMAARHAFAFPLVFVPLLSDAAIYTGAVALAGFIAAGLASYQVGNWAMLRWPSENRLMQFAEPLAGASFGVAAAYVLGLI